MEDSSFVRAEPADLPRDLVAAVLADRWGINPAGVEYLPVGGGGHHWRVTGEDSSRWFITANGLLARGHWLEPEGDAVFERTARAFETVRDLGLDFALPAVPDRTGSVLYRVHREWALSIYPYLDAVTIAAEPSRRVVAGYIGRLHALSPPAGVPRWRPDLPQRQHLEAAIADQARAAGWATGPYGEPARALLLTRHAMVVELLDHYDQLVTAATEEPGRWVLTHGEPHAGNTLHTADGTTLLIDWDTLAIAPPERDLWQLLEPHDSSIWDAYSTASDSSCDRPRPEYMELFPLWWRLAEIGSHIRRFHAPHADSADDATAWRNLESALN